MKPNIAFASIIAVVIVVYYSVFTVHMKQSAILLQLGKPVEIYKEPGLYFKVPFLQQVRYLPNLLLSNDSAPAELITKDKKNLLIDSFTMWRVDEPLKFLQTVRNQRGGQSRLDDIVYSELRVEMGTHDLIDIILLTREAIMEKVTEKANKQARDYGIEVVDVRIKRADLPPEIANSIFNRMRTERERIAKEYRSEGKEEATKIRAQTDKEKIILIAEAYKQEQKLKGEGDGMAIKIYADAFKRDPKFYSFIRSMQAYKQSLKNETTILLSDDSDFLEFLGKSK
ncbi:MAG: protease modulator HflC [Nitrospinota bacterium]|nr:protease modulator HflC [Nitrospinota bacterium]